MATKKSKKKSIPKARRTARKAVKAVKRTAAKKASPKRAKARRPAARSKAKPRAAAAKKAPARAPGLRIHSVVHEVADLNQASSGYARLFGDQGRRIEQGGGRHYFDLGDAVLSLLDVSQRGMLPRTNGSDLYLSVPSLADFHARARELGWLSSESVHGGPAAEIVERPWGERSFYAEDPWGNGICFVEAGTEFTGRQ